MSGSFCVRIKSLPWCVVEGIPTHAACVCFHQQRPMPRPSMVEGTGQEAAVRMAERVADAWGTCRARGQPLGAPPGRQLRQQPRLAAIAPMVRQQQQHQVELPRLEGEK